MISCKSVLFLSQQMWTKEKHTHSNQLVSTNAIVLIKLHKLTHTLHNIERAQSTVNKHLQQYIHIHTQKITFYQIEVFVFLLSTSISHKIYQMINISKFSILNVIFFDFFFRIFRIVALEHSPLCYRLRGSDNTDNVTVKTATASEFKNTHTPFVDDGSLLMCGCLAWWIFFSFLFFFYFFPHALAAYTSKQPECQRMTEDHTVST